MSRNAMAGAVTLCGVGLCMIGGALMMQGGAQAHAGVAVMPSGALAVAGAVNAQAGGEPTVVWYGAENYLTGGSPASFPTIWRAWSDGTIEYSMRKFQNCALVPVCEGAPIWEVFSSPSQGYRALADTNANEVVDGIDLGTLLGSWGDAPRAPFPPSDCPLNLINP
jgi:hypothetical protein